MSTPTVPPRPQRAQGGPTAVHQSIPQIPPRPVRKTDPSPDRELFTRSPLNDPPVTMSGTKLYAHSNLSGSELPRRPPSVSQLPSIGQEGSEYSSYDQLPPEAHGVKVEPDAAGSVEQTRHADVALMQPTASLPQSTAKSRISTVTRTDSSQAAAAGIGKHKPDDDVHRTPADAATNLTRVISKNHEGDLRRYLSHEPQPLRQKMSFNRSTPNVHTGTSRPASVLDNDHELGIPEIGVQVPMYPNAGDVQAPSPSSFQAQFPAGIGFFNDGSSRNHQRRKSSRQEFGPPGSYGLHGHPRQEPGDQFEKEWLAKHPDVAAKEGFNVYTPRPATALSSAELNKLVQQRIDIGMGTSREAIGTPSQEVGWKANELYTARITTPKPSPYATGEIRKRSSSGAHPAVDSSPRKSSFPFLDSQTNRALESEDEDVIHVEPDVKEGSKVLGGGRADNKVDLGPAGGNTEDASGWFNERGDGIPILASDEVLKRPESAFMQAAISPEAERHDVDYDRTPDRSRRSSLQPPSRPTSRPNSMHGGWHGGPLHRFISHEEQHGSGMGTPLEEIEEYEPLFPEGDEQNQKTLARKLKQRPGLAQHHFPSQDIWEDTPESLQYHATVDTPEPARELVGAATTKASTAFETPEQEERRRTQNPEDMTSDNKTFAKPHFKPGMLEELHGDRPGIQRFPSQDIWEDTPDSMRLVTTVSGPQMDEVKSPPDDRPTTTAIPASQDDGEARATTGLTQLMKPQIPDRPQRKSKLAQEIKPELPRQKNDSREQNVPDLGAPKETSSPTKTKAPNIPDKPKPSVPARPARFSHSDQAEGAGAPLAKTISTTSAGSEGSADTVSSPPAPTKAKPAVPARPLGGGKIAALQAGFMSDLNKRLQLGPQAAAPKAREPAESGEMVVDGEGDRGTLADARKGRVKGPARRKAAASSPSGAARDGKASAFTMAMPMTLWEIDEEDELRVSSAGADVADPTSKEGAEDALTANVKSNVLEAAPAASGSGTAEPTSKQEGAEELLTANTKNPALEASPAMSGSSVSAGPETPMERTENPLESPELAKQIRSAHVAEQIGHKGDMPDSLIAPAVAERQQAIQPGLEEALEDAEKAPEAGEEVGRKDAKVVSERQELAPYGEEERKVEVGVKGSEEGSVAFRGNEEVGNPGEP